MDSKTITNDKSGLMKILNERGFDILQVTKGNDYGASEYYLTNLFEPPTVGGIQNSPFLQIGGYNITSFVNQFPSRTAEDIFHQLVKFREMSKKEEVQYSGDFSWIYFKSV